MIFTKDKGFYRSLLRLSLPITLQNLITFSVGLADNVMIGTLGDDAVAGVYMGNMVGTLLQVFTAGIEGAILILAAQYWGKRDTRSIRRIGAIGIRFACLFGVLVSAVSALFPSFVISLFTHDEQILRVGAEYLGIVCFSYFFFCLTQALISTMRSVESARIGTLVSSISLLVDILLNYLLIFGKLGFPALGVRGAAIATLAARIAEAAVIVAYVFLADRKLRLTVRDLFVRDRLLLRDFLRYGLPVMGGQLVWAANMFACSAIMGRQSDGGTVTGLSLANTLNNLVYVVMNGTSGAVGIITGKTIGEGKTDRIREYARTVQILFFALGFLTGGALQLLKNPFISLYRISDEAIRSARALINVLSVTIVGTCYQAACLFGLVKSGGDVSFVLINDAIFVFLIVIPSALIATALGAPAWVVFACLKCDQILKCFVALVKINRFRWMKNLTRSGEKTTECKE